MKQQGNADFSATPKPVIWIDVLSVPSLIAGLKLVAKMGGAQLEYLQASALVGEVVASMWIVRVSKTAGI